MTRACLIKQKYISIKNASLMRKLAVSFLAIIYSFQLIGCGAPPECPWFIEYFEPGHYDLPEGVSVTLVNDNRGMVFHNSTPVELYLIGKIYTFHEVEYAPLPIDFPDGTGPVYKIVNNTNYRWSGVYNERTESIRQFWEVDEYTTEYIALLRNELRMLLTNAQLLELEPRNPIDQPKPAAPQIPDPQHVVLPLVYDNELILMPITIYYVLNTNECPGDGLNAYAVVYLLYCLIFLICPLIVVLFLGAVIIKAVKNFRRHAKIKSQ